MIYICKKIVAMKRLFVWISALLITASLNAQYEIKVKINGVKDTVVYLGHHFGEKKYVVDTAKIDSNGNAVFKKDKFLYRGIYLVIMPSRNMTYFEILVGDNKKFSIETDTADFVKNMKVKGDKENLIFNNYQRYMTDWQEKMQALNKKLEANKDNPDESEKIRKEMNEINKQRVDMMNEIVKNNPDTFFAKIIKSLIDIDIPEPPKDENGNVIDPQFQYRFYKKHYFDNIDFSEHGLLRTPIFEAKLNYYFDKMIVPMPDSAIPEAKYVITKAYESGDTLVFRFTVSHLLHYFETSKVMGYDAVFVSIAEDWYLNGKAYWADKEFLTKLTERVEKISPNKLGNVAPDLKRMQGFDDKYYSLHQVVSDYTILVFYEPSCGHCKKEIPKLMQEYRDTLKELGIKIFAVYTQYDREEWAKFIEEKNLIEEGWINVWDGPYPHSKFRDYYDIYSTPVIFVLDKNKKIIGKRIGVENIKDLIEFEKKKERGEIK
jgi:thiol-disulfide isomerase/thioredoxin